MLAATALSPSSPHLASAVLPSPAVSISWADLASHRDYLVRFARRKLRDPSLAEDAVHDVFEAVLSGRATFHGRAALRSWLTAVLKNKVVDVLRGFDHLESLDDDESASGAWGKACTQPRPDQIAEQRELLARVLTRIDALPHHLRDAMRLRVIEDQPTDTCCSALGISEENLFVRVHRARKQLLS